ncbi:MAG: hypothetical protein UR93_C0019G0004 [Berkelbacteria bacterium GW2011_GWA2_35_9]|uniref:Uncharacterized protein n=1 Tax=Berkelbacteria bacterium GW2011_GWA2_35_9 TaxID=1618333 RepID=A0A0G0D1U2_9BACT|nr:MAG: hypothetical protein UR93_C0019G0004 [Berkelbacteria bacterium GW2011_GWA2_35_9]
MSGKSYKHDTYQHKNSRKTQFGFKVQGGWFANLKNNFREKYHYFRGKNRFLRNWHGL